MLYSAVAHWNSNCFAKIERTWIKFTTTTIIATAIANRLEGIEREQRPEKIILFIVYSTLDTKFSLFNLSS
jgi:lipoprotein signal peptidase